jgi:hypothetical protein
MRLIRTLLVGAAATVLTASGAAADWSGFYLGVHSGAAIIYGGGLQAGFNFQRGNLVFGVGGRAGAIFAGGTPVFYTGGGGKVGVALGAAGNVLLYATGAYGVAFQGGTSQSFFVFGGGAEFAVNDRLSWFAEIEAIGVPGMGGGACCFGVLTGGVNFHFGN